MKILYIEMSITTLTTTILQIDCKIILNFKVIGKSILDPDDNFWRTLKQYLLNSFASRVHIVSGIFKQSL